MTTLEMLAIRILIDTLKELIVTRIKFTPWINLLHSELLFVCLRLFSNFPTCSEYAASLASSNFSKSPGSVLVYL